MSEREAQKTEEVDRSVDVDIGLDDFDGSTQSTAGGHATTESRTERSQTRGDSSGGLVRSVYGRTLGRVLSTRGLGVALVLTVLFSAVFSLVPFVGLLGNLAGIAAAGFVYGLASGNSRYLELGVAGGVVGGLSAFLGNLLVISFGMTALLGVGLLGGALAALLGHYFGRDFRDGLTRDLE